MRALAHVIWPVSLVLLLASCRSPKTTSEPRGTDAPGSVGKAPIGSDPGGVGAGTPLKAREGHGLAAFAGGCFWGTEDAFRHVRGVTATAVGYAGGHTTNPTYETVCDHGTGHAEAVLVEYDLKVTSYAKLVHIFFEIHDPTTLDRQGPDVGTQYRSVVFTFGDEQAAAARAAKETAEKKLGKKAVTEIVPVPAFWKAEAYHQQYAERTGSHGCPTKIPDEST